MELLALLLLLCGSSWWWVPLVFGGNDRRGGCGCFTFLIGAIIGALIIIGYLYEGRMIM